MVPKIKNGNYYGRNNAVSSTTSCNNVSPEISGKFYGEKASRMVTEKKHRQQHRPILSDRGNNRHGVEEFLGKGLLKSNLNGYNL